MKLHVTGHLLFTVSKRYCDVKFSLLWEDKTKNC